MANASRFPRTGAACYGPPLAALRHRPPPCTFKVLQALINAVQNPCILEIHENDVAGIGIFHGRDMAIEI